jgi:hypothetical protein
MKYVFHFSFVGLASTTVALFVLLLASGSLLLPDSKAQMQQQQAQSIISLHFSTSGTAKQVVDAYKAGLKFKDYIAASLKNRESPEHTIIKNQLGSGNTTYGGSDAITKPFQCDSVISFANNNTNESRDVMARGSTIV